MSYATLDELKAFLTIDLADTTDDANLQIALDAVNELIDDFCGRTFVVPTGPASARYYAAASAHVVFIDDAVTVTSVENPPGTVWDAMNYGKEPINGPAKGEPYEELYARDTSWDRTEPNNVLVTATWGWPATPKKVKQATLLQASRMFSRKNSPFGVAGSPETGSELRLLARLDPDVEQLLAPLRRLVVE
jgi:hypothetical protein